MDMALDSFYVCFLLFLFLQGVYSSSHLIIDPNVRRLSVFVLDDKPDCKIIQSISQNFSQSFNCHMLMLPKFTTDPFQQRQYLPCIGVYDSLYHLCEYPKTKIQLKIPESYSNKQIFCSDAKKIYTQLQFSYNGEEMKNWASALKNNITDETSCYSVCTINNLVNKNCQVMLTAANEYLRLSSISGIGLKNTDTSVGKENKHSLVEEHSDGVPNSQPAPKEVKSPPQNTLISANSSSVAQVQEKDKSTVGIVHPRITQPPIISINEELSKKIKINEISPAHIVPDQTSNKDITTAKEYTIAEADILKNGNAPQQQALPQGGITVPQLVSKQQKPENPSEEYKPVHEDGENHESQQVPIEENPNKNTDVVVSENQETDKAETADEPRMIDNEEGLAPEAKDKALEGESDMTTLKKKQQEEDIFNKKSYDSPDSQPWPGAPSFPRETNPIETDESYTFLYFGTLTALCFCAYFLYHYKYKLIALALEGRKGRNGRSGGRGRPNSANYSKLHTNLEDAITCNISTPSATHVLY